jgi:hypothetical protein
VYDLPENWSGAAKKQPPSAAGASSGSKRAKSKAAPPQAVELAQPGLEWTTKPPTTLLEVRTWFGGLRAVCGTSTVQHFIFCSFSQVCKLTSC